MDIVNNWHLIQCKTTSEYAKVNVEVAKMDHKFANWISWSEIKVATESSFYVTVLFISIKRI